MKRVLVISIILCMPLFIFAQQYKIPIGVFGSGGSSASNSLYNINSTAGQSAIGTSTGSSFKHSAGFWQARLIVTDVEDEYVKNFPTVYKLEQNYPNPFNPTTIIQYSLPFNSQVQLEIYDILGRRVEELINSEQSAGFHKTIWNPNVSTGIYFYRINATALDNPQIRFSQTRKLMFIK